MRFLRVVAVTGLLGLAMVARPDSAHAQLPRCTGNGVTQVAPYSCQVTKVIGDLTFDVTLDIDAVGAAEVTFVMAPVQPVDVPIAVRSHTGIAGDPHQYVDAVIPAGFQTVRIVMPRVECGQLDIKAVETKPGAAAGRIAGPYVTWGQSCVPETTTTTTTTTVPPTTGPAPTTTATPPEATSIASTPTSRPALPVTGGTVPWIWAMPTLALAAILIMVSRLPHRDA